MTSPAIETALEIIAGIFGFAVLSVILTICIGSIAIIIDNNRNRRSRR